MGYLCNGPKKVIDPLFLARQIKILGLLEYDLVDH